MLLQHRHHLTASRTADPVLHAGYSCQRMRGSLLVRAWPTVCRPMCARLRRSASVSGGRPKLRSWTVLVLPPRRLHPPLRRSLQSTWRLAPGHSKPCHPCQAPPVRAESACFCPFAGFVESHSVTLHTQALPPPRRRLHVHSVVSVSQDAHLCPFKVIISWLFGGGCQSQRHQLRPALPKLR